jgi:glycosyltransferase involved in cell wall biosynthesis
MSNPKTTIVVLSHNAKSITERFLDLLFKHTENFSLVMIDNGSTDGTAEYLSDIPSILGNLHTNTQTMTLVLNKENLGVIGGRNMGFTIYQSDPTDYLCFLDNDQFVGENWLTQYHNFMAETKSDMCGVDAWLMDDSFMPRYNCKKKGDPYTYVGCGGMLIKKAVVDQIGFFDEQFNPAYFEDPDYNFRARNSGFIIQWNYGAKITHLPHQTLGKNPEKMKIFTQSYSRFKKKWSGMKMPPLR